MFLIFQSIFETLSQSSVFVFVATKLISQEREILYLSCAALNFTTHLYKLYSVQST